MFNFSFNNIKQDWIYMLKGRKKSPFHPLSREFDRQNRIVKTEKGLLEIKQPVGFFAPGKESIELEDVLSKWLVTEDYARLKFEDEPDRSYLAVVNNTIDDFEKMSNFRMGTINFVAKESLGLDKTINVSTSKQHEITGQTETPWKSKTIFNSDKSQYELGSKTGKLILNFNFEKGDVLRIDYKTRSITLNGVNIDVGLSLNSEWFDLVPGYMTLSASNETELTYTERFY